jgi:hypothetical protein
VRSCPREPPRGNQYLSRGQDAHHNSMSTRALDDHCDGQTVVSRGGALNAEDLVRSPSR